MKFRILILENNIQFLAEFDSLDGSSGTCIYLYNLCLNENGVTELSIDHDDTDDIMDVGINEGMDITPFISVAKK